MREQGAEQGWLGCRLGVGRCRMNELEHFLAHGDEARVGLHLARVAAFDELAPEVEGVAMRDAAGGGRHDDELGREEQRFLDAVRDEEEHLARRCHR